MGMVIRNNMDAVRTYNVLSKNTLQLSNSMYKVSSGQRINSAADGPADMAISQKMRARIDSNDQAARNIQNGNNMLKTAEGAVTNAIDILKAMKEKAIEAANDSTSSADRKSLQDQIDNYVSQIDKNADAQYNTMKLLDGRWAVANSGIHIQYGADAGMSLELNISTMNRTGLGITALTVTNYTQATAAIKTIDDAINSAIAIQNTIGTMESRLGFTADNLTTETENLQASESTIRDADMAKEMTNFMKWNVLTQSSQFMLAQAGQNAYSVLNLLSQG